MIELLVAMAITSILMVALLSLVGQSTDSYTQTQRAVNTISQARAFIQFFEREISTRLPGTPLIREASSPDGPESSDKLAFIRTISTFEQDPDQPGDLGTSAYYVAFTPDDTNSQSPKLFRKVLSPLETQDLLEAGSDPPFPATDPSVDEAIIYNILFFEALPRFRDPSSGEFRDWDKTSPEPPSLIELTVRFLDDSSAQRFDSPADWDRLATAPRDSEKQLIRTFNRSIAIAK